MLMATFFENEPGAFVSKRLSDRIIEEAGRRIYESQQERLLDPASFAARRIWRSKDVPIGFWDSYCEDARAVFSLISDRTPAAKYDKVTNSEKAILHLIEMAIEENDGTPIDLLRG
jgi:hypothetical protein